MSDPFSAILGYIGQQETNAANAEQSQNQMNFQERMSNTAYQRQVADLQAAGLNPMLAYIKGGGASTPPGSMATYQSPVSSAVEAYKAPSEVALRRKQAEQTSAQTVKTEAETDLTVAQTALVDSTIKKIKAEISKIGADTDKVEAETENLVMERDRIRAVVNQLQASVNLMNEQGRTESFKRASLAATTEQALTLNLISKAEYQAMKDTGFVGVLARETKVVSDIGSEWVDKLLPWKQGKSTSQEHTDIIRDKDGREVGRSTYRSKK